MRRTKIIATLGPAIDTQQKLNDLVEAGANLFRINTAHGDWNTRHQWIAWIREAEHIYNIPIGVLLDLAGPKVRIGKLRAPLQLREGDTVQFRLAEEQTDSAVPLPVPEVFRAARPGDRLLLDDGAIELYVTRVASDSLEATVLEGGELRSQKGVTLPNRTLALPSMTPKDREDLREGIRAGVDWIALSFVRSASDVMNLHALIREYGASIPVIAKIEQSAALDDLESIVEVADGIMIARGDLGVQVDLAEVPILQKQIIHLCNQHAKPVITATQMLESMIREGRPTRAEAADVANAVLDGTDALMLSGETAIGAYPVQAVRWMARIAEVAEEHLEFLQVGELDPSAVGNTTVAVARAACTMAQMVGAKAILTPTTSGGTPRWVSHFRPYQPILALTDNEALWRRLTLLWGVAPLLIPHVETTDEMTTQALIAARQTRLVKGGDRVVLTTGVPVNVPGNTNMIQVLTIER
ncbi:MAG: pyruvate kinase [Armatimonadota bacterium]|nr:pyruvate kinase [Armatimonadota bacterium]